MMRKTLSVLLGVLLLVSCLSITAFADEIKTSNANITVEASKAEAAVGEDVTFTVYLVNANQVKGGVWNHDCTVTVGNGLTLKADSFDYSNVFTGIYADVTGSSIHSSAFGSTAGVTSEKVKLFSFTCTVAEGATSPMKVSVSGKLTETESKIVTDAEGNEINVTDKISTIAQGGAASVSLPHVCGNLTKYDGQPATCLEDGYETYYKCSCGKLYSDAEAKNQINERVTIPATGHVTVEQDWRVTIYATCTETGVETLYCDVCDLATDSTRPIAALGHTFGEWKVTKEPSCAPGEKQRICSVCEHEDTATVAATGTHKYGDWTVVAATCTADGSKTRVCSVCGGKDVVTLPATGHSFGDWKVTKEATCTVDGSKERVCATCGAKETEVIKAPGHTIGEEWATDKDNHWHVCSVCGEKVDAAAHIFQWVVDKKATAKETGLQHEECETCHYKRNVGTVIPKVTDLDDVPQTGDITPHITFGVISVISMLAAVAFVFKRKAVK